MERNNKTKIAAIADLHVKVGQQGHYQSLFQEISKNADVLLICGDITDTGDEKEAAILCNELIHLTVPAVSVLGNHDYEKGRQKIIKKTLQEHHITVLDGEAAVVEGVGFAGIKGFGGGFDQFMLSIFGEEMMKQFVNEVVVESLQLDRALLRLEQDHPELPKIALMHYAPITETVFGEPEQLYPFLGSSHLAEPLARRQVTAAFHGHAHAGKLKGQTPTGIPVFNVALPVIQRAKSATPYFLYQC